MEEWKVVKGYENLQVSNFGRVWNDKTKKYIGYRYTASGLFYRRIDVDRKKIKVHILVALAFIDNPYNKKLVDHIDNDGENNYVNNLRWATNQDNNRNQRVSKNNRLGIKGVHKRENGKYRSRIRVDGVLINLGTFENLEDAIKSRKDAAKYYFGEFANECEN